MFFSLVFLAFILFFFSHFRLLTENLSIFFMFKRTHFFIGVTNCYWFPWRVKSSSAVISHDWNHGMYGLQLIIKLSCKVPNWQDLLLLSYSVRNSSNFSFSVWTTLLNKNVSYMIFTFTFKIVYFLLLVNVLQILTASWPIADINKVDSILSNFSSNSMTVGYHWNCWYHSCHNFKTSLDDRFSVSGAAVEYLHYYCYYFYYSFSCDLRFPVWRVPCYV